MSLLTGPWGQRIGWTLVHFLWQGALVVALLAMVLQFQRRWQPQVRYVAACCAMGLLVVMPVITFFVIAPPLTSVEEVGATGLRSSHTRAASEHGYGTEVVPYPWPPELVAAPTAVQPAANSSSVWALRFESFIECCLPWYVLFWLAGLLSLSLWHVSGWLLLRRIRRHAKSPLDPRIVEVFRNLGERLRMKQAAVILESALVQAPAVIGWLRPAIVIPASIVTGLSSDQLQAILAHELAHIRRWDTLVRMVQAAVETVLFFHPAVWWVSATLTQESEYCCDEIALEICGDRKTYVRALAFVAGITGGGPPPAPLPGSPLASAATGGKLLPRLRRILGKAGERSTSRAFVAAGIALVLIAAFIPLAYSIQSNNKGDAATQPTTTQTRGLHADSNANAATTRPVLFEEFTIDIGPTIWAGRASLCIKPDGSGTFGTDAWEWPPVRPGKWKEVHFTLGASQMQTLQHALEQSDWLQAKTSIMPPPPDTRDYDFKLDRGGVSRKVRANDWGQGQYAELVKFTEDLVRPLLRQGPGPDAAQKAAVEAIEGKGGKVKWEGNVVVAVEWHNGKTTDEDFELFERFGELRELDVNGNRQGGERSKITDAGLAHLKGLGHLERLVLSHTEITDEGLAQAAEWKKLRDLILDDAPITDAGLVHLERLTELRKLNLRQTKISDAGLSHLKRLLKLDLVDVSDTGVTAAGVKELLAAFPWAVITFGTRSLVAGKPEYSYEVVDDKLMEYHDGLTTVQPGQGATNYFRMGTNVQAKRKQFSVKIAASNADKSVDKAWEAWKTGEVTGPTMKVERARSKVRVTVGEHVMEADKVEVLQMCAPHAPTTQNQTSADEMKGKSLMSQSLNVQREGGHVRISNVPMATGDGNRYVRGLETLLVCAGAPPASVSYERLMGLSGMAFVLQADSEHRWEGKVDVGWWPLDPWGLKLSCDFLSRAVGYELKEVGPFYDSEKWPESREASRDFYLKQIHSEVVRQIDAGRPVLTTFCPANATNYVITGYDSVPDANRGPVWGRCAAETEVKNCDYTGDWPWGVLMVGKRLEGKTMDPNEADLAALRQAVALAHDQAGPTEAPWRGRRFTGQKAWAAWATVLRHVEEPTEDRYHRNTRGHLVANRTAAAIYLRSVAEHRNGQAKEELLAAAAAYEKVLEAIKLPRIDFTGVEKDAAKRREIADKIDQIATLDQEAVVHIERAINAMK
ncbi:MAG: M48 family metalloprotease [Phycisphaerales bacterium]|nr:M48 family metalloprotease [Phycisphaerales bacterium]